MNAAKAVSKTSELTRQALIRSGIEIFGRDGYDGATNRTLADTAGVNQSLIKYHFGNKEGLYLAVFESVSELLGGKLNQLASEVETAMEIIELADGDRTEACIHCIEKLMLRHIELMLQPDMNGYAKLLFREQLEPTKAFEILYEGVMGRVINLISRLVAMAVGKDDVEQTHRLSALMLMGQVHVFRSARAMVTYHMGWQSGIGSERHKQIQDCMRVHIRAIVQGLRLQSDIQPCNV